MEILAPAGSPECLEPAVRCGADAVYLGAPRFSARGNAANFDAQALADAVRYCHARGVRVYLALNTLLRDDELPDALALAAEACRLGIDALIVQDIGLIRLLRAAAPRMKLSASTQMSIHTAAGARLCESLGMRRVVLARELSAAEIRAIRAESTIELEAFAHGALCMSVSGQCYFSAMLGGRSGNRGRCAQTCRLPFAAPGGTGHDLSLKDLSLLHRMDELAAAGVCSAKIEGRMKRPEYVAAAVTALRCDADGMPLPDGLESLLQAVFSRSGFTQGYFDGRRDRSMFGFRQQEDADAATAAVFAQLHTLYRAERARVGVTVTFDAPADAPCVLTLCDGPHAVSVTGPTAEPARTTPLTAERAAAALQKLGGTPFFAESIDCTIADGMTVPMGALNAMRRQAAEALMAARADRPPIPFDWGAVPELYRPREVFNSSAGEWGKVRADAATEHPAEAPAVRPPEKTAQTDTGAAASVFHNFAGNRAKPDLYLCFDRTEQAPDALPPNVGRIFLPLDTPDTALQALGARAPVAVMLPRGMFGCEAAIAQRLAQLQALGIRDAGCGTLNAVAAARAAGCRIHGMPGLNVFNAAALESLRDFGVADAVLSVELTLRQAAAIRQAIPCGVMVYGRVPLMLTRCCPIRNGTDCAHCGRSRSLIDRKSIEFPVRCVGSGAGRCSEVLNSVPLCLLDRLREVPPVSHHVLRFTVENVVEIEEILDDYRAGRRPNGGITRGLSEKGVF